MLINEPAVIARFVERPNRFLVKVRLGDEIVSAHLADPGRLRELLLPDAELALLHRDGAHRKTAYDVLLVRSGPTWVCVNTHLANRSVAEALQAGALTPFADYTEVRAEVPRGHSRFDFRLDGPGRPPCWIEVKSVSLVVDGRLALFPDAPTIRGTRHVRELIEIAASGERAAVLFVIQRDDALRVGPHMERDPDFAAALRQAAQAGVEIHAYGSHVAPEEISLGAPVPVALYWDERGRENG